MVFRLKHENEILSSEIAEKIKSVEKEKSEFIESHMAERRSEIEKLKEHHRSGKPSTVSVTQLIMHFFSNNKYSLNQSSHVILSLSNSRCVS